VLAPGVARAQHPGQRLVAVVAERGHRVEAERVLERRRRPLRPGDLTSRSPGRRDGVQVRVADRVQHPPTGGIRGHRTKGRDLISQRRDVADALPAIDSTTATSTSTRPRPCAVCGAVPAANTADNCAVNVTRSARSARSRAPTCDTRPIPSAETSTPRRVRLACTWKVPSRSETQGSRQAQNPLQDRHFPSSIRRPTNSIWKSQG
jgi:hypothetical protein